MGEIGQKLGGVMMETIGENPHVMSDRYVIRNGKVERL